MHYLPIDKFGLARHAAEVFYCGFSLGFHFVPVSLILPGATSKGGHTLPPSCSSSSSIISQLTRRMVRDHRFLWAYDDGRWETSRSYLTPSSIVYRLSSTA